MDKDKDVQGVAVYAEFARHNATTQVIITPDGFNTSGELVGLSIIRRVITTENPKKPWKFAILEAQAPGVVLRDDELDGYCATRLVQATALLDQLIAGGWTFAGPPVLLETSKKDLDDVAAKKSPSKLLYRVGLSRTALAYPENLINP